MATQSDIFEVSGPLLLTSGSINWKKEVHRRSVAACLVKGVYVMELDRNPRTRLRKEAIAPPWWKSFNFELLEELIDDTDSSIFGAIYEFRSSTSSSSSSDLANNEKKPPQCVIAFRGTLLNGDTFPADFKLDVSIIRNELHSSTRFEKAKDAVDRMLSTYKSSNIWLAGHSLGSAIALLVGKKFAKKKVLLESFLFNPPNFSAPIELIKDQKVKERIRIAKSAITALAALAITTKNNRNESDDMFETLSEWFPSLHVNPSDPICSNYIGYFEQRKYMEIKVLGKIEKLATKHSLWNLVMSAMSKDSLIEEPMHKIPSANLVINKSPARNIIHAHGIRQWWSPDIVINSKSYKFGSYS